MTKKTKKEKKDGISASGIITTIIIVVIACIFGYNAWNNGNVTVPDVVDLDLKNAQDFLDRKGLKYSIEREEYTEEYAKNKVISQSPPKGNKVRKNTVINLVISLGIKPRTIPTFTGLSINEAQDLASQNGLVINVEKRVFDEEMPAGYILTQDPKANSSIQTKNIYLTVSKGPYRKEVPDLTGLSPTEAGKKLKTLGLNLEIAGQKPSGKFAKGLIVSQDPAPEQVIPSDGSVRVWTSSGLEGFITPDLRGLSLEEAREMAEKIGLKLVMPDNVEVKDNMQITYQIPEPGTPMKKVDIYIEFAKSVVVPSLLNMQLDEAKQELEKNILKTGKITYEESIPEDKGFVIEQAPESGIEILEGTTVNLTVGK